MISIIVPVYNAAVYIEETIRTVVFQTYTDWELILVDDCSKDNSAELIRQCMAHYPDRKIRLVSQEKNAGAAAARNRGVDEAEGRYIAFLDADDLWHEEKLDKEFQYMQKHNAGFVFTAYEFGDEKAVPTGKMVRVPKTLEYKKALSRTIIFTSTVLFDTEIVDKSLIHMPLIASEDTATWWQILRTGITAYGLDQPLAIYRRPAQSLSSNKKKAVERIWNLYRNVAGMSAPVAAVYMFRWAWHATVRRVVDDTVWSHAEAFKRFTVVQLSLIGILLQTGIYAVTWFRYLYPIVSEERFTQEGFYLGEGIRLYFRGHLLILLIYFIVLLFMSNSTGGMKTGYLKPGNIFSAEVMALFITNIITYFQICLLNNWLIPAHYLALMYLAQIILAGIWAVSADVIYRNVFPPRETLIINMGDEKQTEEVVERFHTRQDRFSVMKTVQYGGDIEAIKKECLRWYGCVVITGKNNSARTEITEFCYRHYIRVYFVPEISDLLIQGSEQMDLFDIPILELKEYSIRWEARVVKRLVDIIIGFIGTVICSPVLLFKPRETEICLGKGGKPFKHYKGAGTYLNLLNGTMSAVGPEAREESIARKQIEEDERFFYRYRVKPGATGFFQLYGRKNTDELSGLKMDVFYIQHYSLLMDFKLVLQSILRASGRKQQV